MALSQEIDAQGEAPPRPWDLPSARRDDAPAVRAADALLAHAIERRASDVHLKPRGDGGIRDNQLYASQAAPAQASQKPHPERLGFTGSSRDAQKLARAIGRNQGARIGSGAQRLVTLDNRPAELSSGETYPLAFSTSVFGGQNAQLVVVGVHIKVIPTNRPVAESLQVGVSLDAARAGRFHKCYVRYISTVRSGSPQSYRRLCNAQALFPVRQKARQKPKSAPESSRAERM